MTPPRIYVVPAKRGYVWHIVRGVGDDARGGALAQRFGVHPEERGGGGEVKRVHALASASEVMRRTVLAAR